MHLRNTNQLDYDFQRLTDAVPELKTFVLMNQTGNQTIDFSNADAVKLLNKAILSVYYGIESWDVPAPYLCPAVPGRADYIHHMADLLAKYNKGKIPRGNKIRGLDVGTGANCIYPILGKSIYNWSFIASDIDDMALKNAAQIIEANAKFKNHIVLRKQPSMNNYFTNVLNDNEFVDFTICNPPFYESRAEADKQNQRKNRNLSGLEKDGVARNFGGDNQELHCQGGEKQFLTQMITESRRYATNCYWFSSLVSKESNMALVQKLLKASSVSLSVTIPIQHGNKSSRIVAWSFLNQKAADIWRNSRWK